MTSKTTKKKPDTSLKKKTNQKCTKNLVFFLNFLIFLEVLCWKKNQRGSDRSFSPRIGSCHHFFFFFFFKQHIPPPPPPPPSLLRLLRRCRRLPVLVLLVGRFLLGQKKPLPHLQLLGAPNFLFSSSVQVNFRGRNSDHHSAEFNSLVVTIRSSLLDGQFNMQLRMAPRSCQADRSSSGALSVPFPRPPSSPLPPSILIPVDLADWNGQFEASFSEADWRLAVGNGPISFASDFPPDFYRFLLSCFTPFAGGGDVFFSFFFSCSLLLSYSSSPSSSSSSSSSSFPLFFSSAASSSSLSFLHFQQLWRNPKRSNNIPPKTLTR